MKCKKSNLFFQSCVLLVLCSACESTVPSAPSSPEENSSSPSTNTTIPVESFATPTGLRYQKSSYTFYKDAAIYPVIATLDSGESISFSVSPDLPSGLRIDSANGTIAGIPTSALAQSTYTVRASNAAGSTSAIISIKISNISAISAGFYTSCLIVDGSAMCWGSNGSGALGTGEAGNIHATYPKQVVGLSSGVEIIDTAAGFGCAILSGVPKCWGDNLYGKSVGGSLATTYSTPQSVQNLTSLVTKVSGGSSHTCFVVNGGAQCAGKNDSGQLGTNNLTDSNHVVVVRNPQNNGNLVGVSDIASGGLGFTCAVVNGGTFCWGTNNGGQLGNGNLTVTTSSLPIQVQGLTSGVTQIVAGVGHACAIVSGGVQCWGRNQYGQLGNNSTVDSSLPVQAQGLTSGVTAISAGVNHTCAIMNSQLYCWGINDSFQIGTETSQTCAGTNCRKTPYKNLNLTNPVNSVAAGYNHTCVITEGSVKCMGSNDYGQLGNSTTQNSSNPVTVSDWN